MSDLDGTNFLDEPLPPKRVVSLDDLALAQGRIRTALGDWQERAMRGEELPIMNEIGYVDHEVRLAFDGLLRTETLLIRRATGTANQSQTLELRDPTGAGFCPRCRFPIDVHPLDEYGIDIACCPDRVERGMQASSTVEEQASPHEHEWYPNAMDKTGPDICPCGALDWSKL